ncbi:MAG: hypothetical protein QGG02_04105 [Gammaproteobacteria bacterium]|nr:hypothetical protein [Gammaproteobacteria bacterium]MDP6733159.1 hypothetical protein [Gammaproteobacteria bacterium]
MRITSLKTVLAGLLSLLLVSLATAQDSSRQVIEVESLGPQIGERVPGFSLPDQNGQIHTLESIMGPNGAMLLFHRSADW